MALEDIANEDRVITKTPTGAATWTPGEPDWDEHPSDKVQAGGKKILVTRISWSFLAVLGACVKAGYIHTAGSALDPIGATATKVNETNLPGWAGPPIRKGDKGKCSGTFQNAGFPFDVVNCTCDFEVTDAGQTKAKAQ